jgi:hypothetical protein
MKLVVLSAGTSAANGWTSFQQMGNFVVGGTSALRFISMPPCRVVDTRDATKPSGFGPPSLSGGATRSFRHPERALRRSHNSPGLFAQRYSGAAW